jgi:hypothetical protein
LDSISSQQIPKETLEDILLNDGEFRVYEFSPDLLETTEPRSTKKEDDVTHKRLFHENKWAFLQGDQAERIKNILLADIHVSDIENWINYLNKNLSFPFNVKTLGELGPVMKFKVTGIDSINETHGIIMTVEKGKQKGSFPLSDMAVTQKKNPNYHIVQDYLEWAEDTLYTSDFF